MAARWIEALTGSLEQKKQYKTDLARTEALPEPYRAAAKACHRYLLQTGGVSDGDTLVKMVSDHTDLWERAAADAVPVSAVIGDDPVDFVETFMQAYQAKHWLDKERARLVAAIEDAKRGEQ